MKTINTYSCTPEQTDVYLAQAREHILKLTTDPKYPEKFFYTILKSQMESLAFTLHECYHEYIDSDEVANELYITLWSEGTWSRLYTYKGKSSFTTWLVRVAQNAAFRHFDEMGYHRNIKVTVGNTRLRLLSKPEEIRRAVVDLVYVDEFHNYLTLRYVQKISDDKIREMLGHDEVYFKDLRRASVRTLKSALLETDNDYADLVLRKVDAPVFVGEDSMAKVSSDWNEGREKTEVEEVLKTCHGIDPHEEDYKAKLESYILKYADKMGFRGNKAEIFVQRFVYDAKPEELAERFKVKRAQIDCIKSKGTRRFSRYVLSTCRA